MEDRDSDDEDTHSPLSPAEFARENSRRAGVSVKFNDLQAVGLAGRHDLETKLKSLVQGNLHDKEAKHSNNDSTPENSATTLGRQGTFFSRSSGEFTFNDTSVSFTGADTSSEESRRLILPEVDGTQAKSRGRNSKRNTSLSNHQHDGDEEVMSPKSSHKKDMKRSLRRDESTLVSEACHVMMRGEGSNDPGRSAKFIEEDRTRLCNALMDHGDGSLLRGWRVQLDPNGKLEVDFADYIQASARMKFSADPENLFSGPEKTITLQTLAPFEFALLDRFKIWLKENLGSPKQFFKELDKDHIGEVDLEQFCSFVSEKGFEATDDDLEELFIVCDYLDNGFIKWEDVVFLESDAKVRAAEMYKIKVSQLMHWKQVAAKEYISYKKGLAKLKGELRLSPKHRLAPRPWMADTFERMPAVVAQAQHQRQVDNFKREKHAREFFIDHLCKTYGNEVRAMRRVLAWDGGYSFGSQTLRSYCRRLNFDVEPRDIWNALDQDGDGQVTVEELCVNNALVLAQLQQWARRTFGLGSCAAIFNSDAAAAVSRKRSGTWYRGKRMLASVFIEILKELGWHGVKNEKWRHIVVDSLDTMNLGTITPEDLEWLDKWRPVEWVYSDPDPEALTQVKALLHEKYGHPLRAWRVILDADDSNNVDWQEFKKACQKLKFRGNAAGAWRALDVDLIGRITMKQFDPDSASLLASFKEWAEANFGSIGHCFKSLDTDRSGSLTFPELKRASIKLNWQGDVRLLFDCLDVDRVRDANSYGKRSISFDEISFLDTWEYEIKIQDVPEDEPVKAEQREKHEKLVASITARLANPLSCQRRMPFSMPFGVPLESTETPPRTPGCQGTRAKTACLPLEKPATAHCDRRMSRSSPSMGLKRPSTGDLGSPSGLPRVNSASELPTSPTVTKSPSWARSVREQQHIIGPKWWLSPTHGSEPVLSFTQRVSSAKKRSSWKTVELQPIGQWHLENNTGSAEKA